MKVNVLEEKIVFDDFFRIEQARLQYEQFDGEMSDVVTRLNFERGDSVAAIIFDLDSSLAVLVSQFKYPAYTKGAGWITEVVAGIKKNAETEEEAIKREVFEETGYEVKNIEKISSFFVSPGGSSERIILFYIETNGKERINKGGGLKEENEDIKNVEYSLEELKSALTNNNIQDAKTIIACNYLLNKKNI
jgi:ADP-ribose pyrophosphatase